MCCLPVNQPLLLPGDTRCSPRRPSPCSAAHRLASRLRRIGDQLEKSWTAEACGDGFACAAGGRLARPGRWRLESFLFSALRLTVLVLVLAKRHF